MRPDAPIIRNDLPRWAMSDQAGALVLAGAQSDRATARARVILNDIGRVRVIGTFPGNERHSRNVLGSHAKPGKRSLGNHLEIRLQASGTAKALSNLPIGRTIRIALKRADFAEIACPARVAQ